TVQEGFRGAGGGFTFYHVKMVFADAALREGLRNSFGIAACTTVLCLLIALPLAVVSAKFDFPGKGIFSALILAPMILPPFVGAIGLSHLLGRSGAINSLLMKLGLIDPGAGIDFLGGGGFWAIVAIQALALYPILYLNATAALANLDPALEEAAENLGAGWWRRFFGVVLPLIRPGLFAGATIVFIWSFTELGTPLMFDYQVVTPVQIFNGIKEMATSKTPYALTAVMLLSAVLLYVMGKMVFGGRAYAMYSKASIQSSAVRLRGWRGAMAAGLFVCVIGIAILPHISVILVSFTSNGQWYQTVLPREFTAAHYSDALQHQLAVGSIRNSLFYASMAVMLDLGLGLMIGYLIVRTRMWGRGLLDSLSMLPLAVPGLVLAFGYVAMTLNWPFEGPMPEWLGFVMFPLPQSWFDWLNDAPLKGLFDVIGAEPNPIPLLIIAYAIRRLPYVVRSTVAGLEQTSGELEEAALNLGASRVRAVRTIVVPLIAANLIAGGLLAFSFAMLEVSDSLILAQREAHFPITKAIYVLFERLGDGMYIASAMGVWGMALLAVTLIGASMMMGKKMGAIFRV
ncbi:MAG: iron ABC transporter permease, partial [Phycisphaerales bacterium]|nr:iron ABC transporter permease [Phycisphaerales bacterium]